MALFTAPGTFLQSPGKQATIKSTLTMHVIVCDSFFKILLEISDIQYLDKLSCENTIDQSDGRSVISGILFWVAWLRNATSSSLFPFLKLLSNCSAFRRITWDPKASNYDIWSACRHLRFMQKLSFLSCLKTKRLSSLRSPGAA